MDFKAEELILKLCRERSISLGLAESCTGGALSARLTSLPGSSKYFKGAIIAYSEEFKQNVLKVAPETLAKFGAVSEETCLEMIQGIFDLSDVNFSLAITGIAGPESDLRNTPIGTIYIASAFRNQDKICQHYLFKGNRSEIIQQSLSAAMDRIIQQIKEY